MTIKNDMKKNTKNKKEKKKRMRGWRHIKATNTSNTFIKILRRLIHRYYEKSTSKQVMCHTCHLKTTICVLAGISSPVSKITFHNIYEFISSITL